MAVLGFVAISVVAACSTVKRHGASVSEQAGVPFKGAPSVDALVDQFVAGVAAKDTGTLHTLRVNEAEYRRIIVPGSAPVGKTPTYVADMSNEFFWRMLDQKSRDFLDVVLNDYGGHPLQRGQVTYTKKPRQYAWYRAYGEVRIPVSDGQGHTALLKSGWIAEVDGQYKFIGFNWDD